MNETLEKGYFEWLKEQVSVDEGRTRMRYKRLLRILHDKEFVWIIPNDDNRVHDGWDLRSEYLGSAKYIFEHGVSVLEVIVALSRRLEFMAEGHAPSWAGTLIKNLDLHLMSDPLSTEKIEVIDEMLEALIWRTYDRDGTGGFFPLAWSEDDQTKVEIWYQMSAYVNEMHDM